MSVISYRRTLHALAEKGFCEYETKKYILSVLSKCGCAVSEIGETGIAAFFDFNSSKTIAFRAELDALPMKEKTGLAFASHTGYMHACGHDAHMAMLLALSEALSSDIRESVNVLMIFQPAEELCGGSESIISSGIFNNIKTDELFALHLKDGLAAGNIFCRSGVICAGSSEADVIFDGEYSHLDGKNNSAVISAAEFLIAVNKAADKNKHCINFGTIRGGVSRNTVAGSADLQGTIRYFSQEEKENIKNMLIDASERLKTPCKVFFRDYAPPVVNSLSLLCKVKAKADISDITTPFLMADDFALYSKAVPETLYLFLGAGDTPSLHSDNFSFDETVLYSGSDFLKTLLT